MAKLEQCGGCQGFVPNGKSSCPNCGLRRESSRSSRLLWIGGALGGGAIAFTLMACYGMPPCKDGTRDCYKPDGSSESTKPLTTTPPTEGDGGAPTTAPSK